jgi:hypothetical protein
MILVKFVGIDYWSRPVFKNTEGKDHYGSTEILFAENATEQEVLKVISETDLLYFGNSFGCEPMGTVISNIKIQKENNMSKKTATVKEKLNELAFMKKDLKELEATAKELQRVLIEEDGVACDFVTPNGKLAFTMRENYEVTNKTGLIKQIGQKGYNAHSTISKSGVEKAVGELGFQEVLDKELMAIKTISQFFVLRK